MFQKLRLKLTLTNVAVVSIIFLIFITGVYIAVRGVIKNQEDQLINVISSNAGLDNVPLKPGHNDYSEHQYRYFYVMLNPSGEITSVTPNQALTAPLNDLASKVLSSSRKRGNIEWEGEPYLYVKSALKNGTGSYVIFVNTHFEHEILDKLLMVLALTGIAGLILVFFGGLFMANRSLIPVKESWKRQRDFVADASHELRTPLAVIETTLDLIISKSDQTVDSQMKWLENIQTENKRMTKLVNDLLFLARTDSKQVALELKTFPLHSALLEAYIPFEAIALRQGIQLESFDGPQIDFLGDEERLKQLAVILVDNAIKHTSSGGKVKLALLDMGSSVEIVVSDTGEGIDKEHIHKIFQRFYRVDKARSRKEGSVGLGLSIAEWIVKEHRGVIKVDSVKDRGTTFRVILPRS